MTRIVTNQWMRSSASTGARISPSRFSPTSPKGGFVSSIYEGARYIDERYGYRTESYYRKRLFGETEDDRRWRSDLNTHLLMREHQHKTKYATFPRFPKKKFPKTYRENVQKSTKFRGGKLCRRDKYGNVSERCRQHRARTNYSNRRKNSYWQLCEVH